ncbi:TlpA family protein disulfide reductase [Spirosoma foliorum]|uniref:TlpA family protein disulfide reductase n=1 Tax=Spirosoma foliorum TaxID=2710596 RepID=A0A7G5H159_9BACT|nr:TlpA disulfide reductase family protein [Spirosoma foliorum]QMW04851.1 TlpA family protein disulfide reductase [Spirosoma foliorum]
MISSEPISIGHVLHQETNQVVLEVVIPGPQFAFLEIDGTFLPLYLEPRRDLQLYMGSTDPTSIRFEGPSAIANGYLAKAHAIRQRAEQSAGRHYTQLSLTEFTTHLNAVRGQYERLDQTVLAKTNLADSLKEVLSARNQVSLIFIQQNYVLAHYGEKLSQVPDPLKAVVQPPLFNSRFVRFKMSEYADIAHIYVSYILRSLLSSPKMISDSTALAVDRFIQNSPYSLAEKDYLRAKNCYNWLTITGIIPATDQLITQYKASFPNSFYLSTLAQLYQKWSALASGQPAPDFYGVTPRGDTLALSSLKGKVVYVDVWATWCMPCRAEFPQANQLQQQFSSTPGVVFLYVSIDQNQVAWKKLLQDDTHLTGIHINQASVEQAGSLWKPYLLISIPRYILIDQKGRIVQANADRPSSGKVAAAIQELML